MLNSEDNNSIKKTLFLNLLFGSYHPEVTCITYYIYLVISEFKKVGHKSGTMFHYIYIHTHIKIPTIDFRIFLTSMSKAPWS